MGRPGFEPGTNRLKAEYSTVELATQLRFATLLLYHQHPGFCQEAFRKNLLLISQTLFSLLLALTQLGFHRC
ncbi:MAG: hypothetical protein RLZZ203_2394 [Cyanobacteriota bacterium]